MASPFPTKAMDRMWKYNIEEANGASEERLAEIMKQIEEATLEDRRDAAKSAKGKRR